MCSSPQPPPTTLAMDVAADGAPACCCCQPQTAACRAYRAGGHRVITELVCDGVPADMQVRPGQAHTLLSLNGARTRRTGRLQAATGHAASARQMHFVSMPPTYQRISSTWLCVTALVVACVMRMCTLLCGLVEELQPRTTLDARRVTGCFNRLLNTPDRYITGSPAECVAERRGTAMPWLTDRTCRH